MGNTDNRMASADALVIFGVTGDLCHKIIFPALYAMARRGVLNVPVVGVAAPNWSTAQLRKQVKDSIRQAARLRTGKPSITFCPCSSMSAVITTTRGRSGR